MPAKGRRIIREYPTRHHRGHLLAGGLFCTLCGSRHPVCPAAQRGSRRLRHGAQYARPHCHAGHAAGFGAGGMDSALPGRVRHLGRDVGGDRLCAGFYVTPGGHAGSGTAHARADAPWAFADGISDCPLWPAPVRADAGHHGVLCVHRADRGDHGHFDADDIAGTGADGADGGDRDGHGAALHGGGRVAGVDLHR